MFINFIEQLIKCGKCVATVKCNCTFAQQIPLQTLCFECHKNRQLHQRRKLPKGHTTNHTWFELLWGSENENDDCVNCIFIHCMHPTSQPDSREVCNVFRATHTCGPYVYAIVFLNCIKIFMFLFICLC